MFRTPSFFAPTVPTTRDGAISEIIESFEGRCNYNLSLARQFQDSNQDLNSLLDLYMHIDGMLDHLPPRNLSFDISNLSVYINLMKVEARKACMDDAISFRKITQLLRENTQMDLDCAYMQMYFNYMNIKHDLVRNISTADSKRAKYMMYEAIGYQKKEIKLALHRKAKDENQESKIELRVYKEAMKLLKPYISSEAIAYLDGAKLIELPMQNGYPGKQLFLYVDLNERIFLLKILQLQLIDLKEKLPESKQGKIRIANLNNLIQKMDEQIALYEKEIDDVTEKTVQLNFQFQDVTVNIDKKHLNAPVYFLYKNSKPLFTLENELESCLRETEEYLQNYLYSEELRAKKYAERQKFYEKRQNAYSRYREELLQVASVVTDKSLASSFKPVEPEIDLAQALKPHRDVFMQIFSKPVPNRVLRFTDLCACVKAVGGKIMRLHGSKYRIKLAVNASVYEVDGASIITTGAHAPHGKSHNNDKVLAYVVTIFKDAFEAARITPEIIWPAEQPRVVPSLGQ